MTNFNSDRYNLFTQFQETGNRLSSKILFSWPISYGPSSNLEESFGQCWKVLLLNVEKFFILISVRASILTSQNYFNNKFASQNLNWKKIYVLPHIYLFFNISFWAIVSIFMIFLFEKSTTLLCSFCVSMEKTTENDFSVCHVQLKSYFDDCIVMLDLTPQTAIFCFHDSDDDFIISNHSSSV